MGLSQHWPLFDLRIRTPRLELRYPCDDDLAALIELVGRPVHPVDRMPFTSPWTRAPSPQRERDALRFWWRQRASVEPTDWVLPFVVLDGGETVGVQDLAARHFPVTGTAQTGSWITMDRQGRGIGKEMRAAVLHLAFAGLGAAEAHTSAFEDNPASIGVTTALGYEPNGAQIDEREGAAARHLRFVLTRERWEERRRDDIEVHGLEPCLPILGLA
jgi:RimJ/RimL family protein N-acetyltransferase